MKLNNTIKRLTHKPNNSVTIINMETAEKIVCDCTGTQLMQEYGTVENYFENLYKKGITKIKVHDRNPNGSRTIPAGEPYTVLLGSENETDKPTTVKQTVVENRPQAPAPGLHGAEAFGLSGAQIEVAGKLFNYPQMVSDLRDAKSKIDRLEIDNADLKTKLSRLETLDEKGEKTAAGQTQTLSMAKELLKEAMPLIMSFKSGGTPSQAPPGLAGVKPIHQEAINALLAYDDATIHLLGRLIEKANDDDVWNDLDIIMTKYQIA